MNLLGKIIKVGMDVATLPVEVAKDVITGGGIVTEEDESYTIKRLKELLNEVEGD